MEAKPESSLYRYDFARALLAGERLVEAASELERVVQGDDAANASAAGALLWEIRARVR